MYDRNYDGRIHHFEASGGLIHGALVMQDMETDTYWSIMTGDAIAGPLRGTPLQIHAVSRKMRWKDWLSRHPDTLILSVNGEEDVPVDPYASYFDSPEGFAGLEARDRRLETKAPIFAFQLGDRKIAVPFNRIENGRAFDLGEVKVFLYRARRAPVFYSTAAFYSRDSGFKRVRGQWHHEASGARFNPDTGRFEGGTALLPQPLEGIDTFWYMWSLTHPDTEVRRR